MGHGFLDRLRKNVELNMETGTIFWDNQNGNGNYILGRMEYYTPLFFFLLVIYIEQVNNGIEFGISIKYYNKENYFLFYICMKNSDEKLH